MDRPRTDRPPPDRPRKGRGAVGNVTHRFSADERASFDDGWGSLDEELPPLRTTIIPEAVRTIITRNASPDIPFSQSINPYKGCEHGCIYCYARPTHAYLGLSPGLDFETQLISKDNAAAALTRELRRRGYTPAALTLGANTDPYQPIERTRKVTRSVLEVLTRARHPVAIITKSHRVVRDLDLLTDLARDGLVRVFLSITTLDPALSRVMEPRASTPARRVQALEKLVAAGVPVGVMAAPMIPALNDSALESVLDAAASAGATTAGWVAVRLPWEIKELFEAWLGTHFPDRKARVLAGIRGIRGGALNDPRFGSRMRGTGPWAALMTQRFRVATARLGLQTSRTPLRTDLFVAPRKPTQQLDLFAG